MKDEQRIKSIEDELKVLKNEVQAVLLDLRDQYLNLQNPFNQNMIPGTGDTGASVAPGEQEVRQPKAEDSRAGVPSDSVDVAPQIKPGMTQKQLPTLSSADDIAGLWPRPEVVNEDEFREELSAYTAQAVNAKKTRKPEISSSSGKVDLVVIAGLTQWLDQATVKLGKERTEVMVEISYAMGRLPENLKDALVKMARLSHHEAPSGQSIAAGDYLSLLAQLENLLAGSKEQDNAILSILSMMKDTRNG